MSKDLQHFAALPPQGFAFMTDLQRFDHKVRCAVLEVLRGKTVGCWNVAETLRQIEKDLGGLLDEEIGALAFEPKRK